MGSNLVKKISWSLLANKGWCGVVSGSSVCEIIISSDKSFGIIFNSKFDIKYKNTGYKTAELAKTTADKYYENYMLDFLKKYFNSGDI